jgi:hypothetical protein
VPGVVAQTVLIFNDELANPPAGKKTRLGLSETEGWCCTVELETDELRVTFPEKLLRLDRLTVDETLTPGATVSELGPDIPKSGWFVTLVTVRGSQTLRAALLLASPL